MTQKRIIRTSLDEVQSGELTKEELDMLDNAPEGPALGDDFWENAQFVAPGPKRSIHIRVDQDIFDFFKEQGSGHLTRMHAVLRHYVDAHKQETPEAAE